MTHLCLSYSCHLRLLKVHSQLVTRLASVFADFIHISKLCNSKHTHTLKHNGDSKFSVKNAIFEISDFCRRLTIIVRSAFINRLIFAEYFFSIKNVWDFQQSWQISLDFFPSLFSFFHRLSLSSSLFEPKTRWDIKMWVNMRRYLIDERNSRFDAITYLPQ